MLIDHRLSDAPAGRNLLDRGGLIAPFGEQGAPDIQQLLTPLNSGHPHTRPAVELAHNSRTNCVRWLGCSLITHDGCMTTTSPPPRPAQPEAAPAAPELAYEGRTPFVAYTEA